MEILKNIFARIWAVWGILVFILTLLLFFPFFLLCFFWKEPRRSYISHRLYWVWMSIYLTLIGVIIRLRNKQFFKKGENYVVVCNHISMMDVPVVTPFIPGPNKTIAKIEMSKIPLFGTLYKLGSVLVDRKDKDSRLKSFLLMKDVLAQGLHMCIYPEGTRNKTGLSLKDFHDGAFKLAVDTQKKILPAILKGTARILPFGKTFYLMPGVVEFRFYEAIEAGVDVEVLKKKVFDMMWGELEDSLK